MLYKNYNQWDKERLEHISFHRCIQVEDIPNIDYTDYHTYNQQKDQEDLNGAYLVDHIIEQRFFPNGRWDA